MVNLIRDTHDFVSLNLLEEINLIHSFQRCNISAKQEAPILSWRSTYE
jgi:hypothetical protein